MSEKIKVLVVEDEAITAMSLRIELERAGFEITDMVATAEDAIQRTKHLSWCLWTFI